MLSEKSCQSIILLSAEKMFKLQPARRRPPQSQVEPKPEIRVAVFLVRVKRTLAFVAIAFYSNADMRTYPNKYVKIFSTNSHKETHHLERQTTTSAATKILKTQIKMQKEKGKLSKIQRGRLY